MYIGIYFFAVDKRKILRWEISWINLMFRWDYDIMNPILTP